MGKSNQLIKKICVGLGALVVVLLLAIAFLLGKQSAAKKTDGAGRSTDSASLSGVTAAPETAAPDNETGTVPADAVSPENPAETTAVNPADPAAPTAPPVTVPPASDPAGSLGTLEIEMSSGSLTVEKGAAFDVKYDASVIRVERSGNRVTIRNDHSNPSAAERKRMDVTVVVPDGYAFDDVSIEMGAGKLITRTLQAKNLQLEMGAGSATLEGLSVTGSADIKNGAGAFSIKSGAINNLTLQCGAGATQVKAALTGSSRIVAAVGAVDLQFDGRESDYTVAFKMSLGACYYNDTKISRSGTFGTGPNRVDITGGFGVMRVNVG